MVFDNRRLARFGRVKCLPVKSLHSACGRYSHTRNRAEVMQPIVVRSLGRIGMTSPLLQVCVHDFFTLYLELLLTQISACRSSVRLWIKRSSFGGEGVCEGLLLAQPMRSSKIRSRLGHIPNIQASSRSMRGAPPTTRIGRPAGLSGALRRAPGRKPACSGSRPAWPRRRPPPFRPRSPPRRSPG